MNSSLVRWVSHRHRKRRKQKARLRTRHAWLERLEPRVVLNGRPIAVPDPWYSTDVDTALTVDSQGTTLLDNDSDPEGSSLTASIVDNPANGTVSNFTGTAGTFTYTPDTAFSGVDTFTYKVSDGTNNSNVVAVSIAVGGDFGPRTNLEERTRGSQTLTGGLALTQELTPGLFLQYQSNTLPQPIIVAETWLLSGSSVPDEIRAKLTFNGSAGTDYAYDTTGLSAGDSLRFALQADATSLSTGRYDYTVDLTADYTSSTSTRSFSGSYDVVNRGGSTHPFGRGWQLAGLDELDVDTDGVLLVRSNGDAFWFAEDGSGGYDPAEGDETFSTLVKNQDDTYTLTDKHGSEANFDSSGKLTSRVDRNDNTISYTYTNGLLTKITDPFNRDTTLTYTSGQLTSVSDFASRSATLTYASGRLTSVTQPDPDGAGPLSAPVWDLTYDATSHLLTGLENPLNDSTTFTYGAHDRLTKVTHPDASDWELTSLQTIGLPTGSSGNSLTSADPEGTVTDERNKNWKFRTDRFGNLTEWENPLGDETLTERQADGLVVKLTEEDPDGAGSQTSPITIFGYDDEGNLVYQENPDDSTKTWTYTTSFNFVATATNELGDQVSFSYDTSGNLTTATDAADHDTTYTYNTDGLVTKITTPDPDGAGSQSAADTSFAYDSYGRVTTLTNPDTTTVTFTYDSADNTLSITDELSKATSFEYDELNRRTSVTDREDAETTYEYNALGLLTKQTDALGHATEYTYNSRGWLTKTTFPDPDGAGPLGKPENTRGYDAAGNLTSEGQFSWTTQASVSHAYDNAGRRTSTTGPLTDVTTSYTYDSLGRLIKVMDDAMRTTDYERNSRGWLTKVTGHDPDGAGPETGPVTQYSYDAAGQTLLVLDPRGYATSYTYDERGLVTSVWEPDPDGSGPLFRPVTYLIYDDAGRLIETEDVFRRKTKYEYSSRDWLTKITLPDPDGTGSQTSPVTSLSYDAAGRRTSDTDPLSRVTSYAYDDEGRVTSVTDPDPDGAGSLSAPVTSYAYNALGSVTSITDPLSNVTSFEYDTLQRRTKITEPDPDGAGSLTAPVTTLVYNAQGKLDKITDPLGSDTTFQYDSVGRRTGVTDDAGNKTTYAYDVFDNLTRVTLPDPDNTGPLTASVTSYTYDDYHRRKSITNAEGGVTTFTYDDAGNLLTLKDPETNVTTWAYDGLGRITIETNELDDSRSFVYDSVGNLTRRTDRNERVIQFVYDDLDRLIDEKWLTSATPAPSISIATTQEGGSSDEVQRVGFTTGMGFSGGTFTLTFDGYTTSAITYNASAATVESELESLTSIGTGNVSVTKLQDTSTAQEWQITFQGTLAGTNVAQTTIDASNVQTMMGPPTEIEATDAQGYGDEDEEQTITISNADDGTFRLAFKGYTTAPIDHDATAANIDSALEELNSVDLVTVTGNAEGPWTVTFVGSHSGQNVERLGGDTSNLINGTEGNTVDYVYDAASQLTSISDDDSSYAYTYDNLGRMLTVDNNNTSGVPRVILTSAYDANSNRTSLSADIAGTDDFLNTYTYDNLNRLTRVDQVGQTGGNTVAEKRVDFAYNAIGQFTSIARYNDTDGTSSDEIATSEHTYDTLHRLTDLAYKNGGTNLFTPYEWSYDSLSSVGPLAGLSSGDVRVAALTSGAVFQGLGRVTQFVSADGTTDYTYDKTSQLTDADHTYQTDESYSYDDNGNRTMTGYTTGTNNQLTNDGTFSYAYDDEGNRTSRTNDTTEEVTEYDWDHRNRLVKVTEKDDMGDVTQVVEYKYDVFNRRISKAVDTTSPFDMADAVIERYVYDDINGVTSLEGGNVVLDFVDPDGTGSTQIALEKRYLYGNAVDQILAQEDVTVSETSADRVYWPLVDNLGTVRDLAKNDGTLGQHYKYDSFGNVTSGDTSVTRYLFTSREFDADVDLQYSRARWYDAATGRWISEDPAVFFAGDVNLVRYALNVPTVFIDPSGFEGQFTQNYPHDSEEAQVYAEWMLTGNGVGAHSGIHSPQADWLDVAAIWAGRSWDSFQGAFQEFAFQLYEEGSIWSIFIDLRPYAAPPLYGNVDDYENGGPVGELTYEAMKIAILLWTAMHGGANCFVAGTLVHMGETGSGEQGVGTPTEENSLNWMLLASASVLATASVVTHRRRARNTRDVAGQTAGQSGAQCTGAEQECPWSDRDCDVHVVVQSSACQHATSVANESPYDDLQKHAPSTASTRRRRSILLALSASLLLAVLASLPTIKYRSPSAADASLTPTVAFARPVLKPIEQVQVGERVAYAENPDEPFDDTLGHEIDPPTWRKIELAVNGRHEEGADVVLLRPEWWIRDRLNAIGQTLTISIPEVGIYGEAVVRAIKPCPTIIPTNGAVVIGTFRHWSPHIVNLHVAGLETPIKCTQDHRIWSQDRQAFIPAAELEMGEQIQCVGGSRRVIKVTPGQPSAVFNLEVFGQHVFQVSPIGVLVHNAPTGGDGASEAVDPGRMKREHEEVSKVLEEMKKIQEQGKQWKDEFNMPPHQELNDAWETYMELLREIGILN